MASMLGKATYLDEHSEELWSSFVKDMNDFYERYNTIPVGDESLFPDLADLLGESGKSQAELDAIYKERGFERKKGTGYYNRYVKDGDVSAFLSTSDKGEKKYKSGKGATPIHEYFHYLDRIMNKAMGDKHGGAGIAKRMAKYGEDLSEEEMLEAWMNDPETEHLNLDNPENKGLRTLLKNRLHHGGVVDVREGVGKFLASMLNNEQYNKWSKWFEEGLNTSYYSDPSEMLAYAAQPIVKETKEDKAYEDIGWFFDRNWEGLDKDLADSIATYLNARELENKGWTN